jgi:hypothetical protein
MHDHLTTSEIRDHIARLRRALRQPTGMAYTPSQYAADSRELDQLQDSLHARKERS